MVGLHGAGTSSRSNPPLRKLAASFHHDASDGSCSVGCSNSCSKFAAMPAQPGCSHMLTTCGHRPVEPTVPQMPKHSCSRSAWPIGLQLAVMWCMYLARLGPRMSTSSWM